MAKAVATKAKVSRPKSTQKGAANDAKTAKSVNFAYDGATITANIAKIRANDAEQEKLVHLTCRQCVVQIMAHRNTDYATRLLNALGKGWRTTSLVKWVENFTPVKLKSSKNADTGVTTRAFKVLAEDDPLWIAARKKFDKDPEKFTNLPTFWDFDPEVIDYRGVDFLKLIESAVKKAEKANVYPKGHVKEGQPLSAEDARKNNLVGLAQARALLSTLRGAVHPGTAATQ